MSQNMSKLPDALYWVCWSTMLRFAVMSTVRGFADVSCVVMTGMEESSSIVLALAVLVTQCMMVMHWAQTHRCCL